MGKMGGEPVIAVMREGALNNRLVKPIRRRRHPVRIGRVPLQNSTLAVTLCPLFELGTPTPRVGGQLDDVVPIERRVDGQVDIAPRDAPLRIARVFPQPLNPHVRMRPDGAVIEVRRNTVPGGGVVLIYSDITARKRSEEQIRTARDLAETRLQELKTAQSSLIHAEKMASLGQLTAGIAHELKNPLNFINNFASLAQELLVELKEELGPALAADGTLAIVAMTSVNIDLMIAPARSTRR